MKKEKLLRRINFLELYLIIGGLIGIIIQVDKLLSLNLGNYESLFSFITLYLPFIFFLFSIYNGLLLTYKKYELGLKLARFNFCLQLISFIAFGLCYEYYLGIGINIALELTNDTIFGLGFNFSEFVFGLVRNVNAFEIRFNVLALFMIYFISKVLEDLKNCNLKE